MLRSGVLTLALFAAAFASDSVQARPSVSAKFNATVSGPMTRPIGCAAGVTVCGDAEIAGYGSATYTYAITFFQPTAGSCGEYTADVVFSLADGSTLTLAETGTVCGPGKSFFPQPAPGGSYGNPVNGVGAWTVIAGTGQFAGATGSGTNGFHSAGASLSATYTGDVN